MAYTSPPRYIPSAMPMAQDQLARATWDELYSIAQALLDLDQPAALVVEDTTTVPVAPTPGYTALLASPVSVVFAQPAGTLSAAGVWTCPVSGLWQLDIWCVCPALPTPAIKTYQGNLRVTHTLLVGAPKITTITAEGADTQVLTLDAAITRPILAGETVHFELDLTHESITTSVLVTDGINLVRLSSLR